MINKKTVLLIVFALFILLLLLKSSRIISGIQKSEERQEILKCVGSVRQLSVCTSEFKQKHGVYPNNFNCFIDEFEKVSGKIMCPWETGIEEYWNFVPMWGSKLSFKNDPVMLVALATDDTICMYVKGSDGVYVLRDGWFDDKNEKMSLKEIQEKIRKAALMVVSNYNRTGSLSIPVQQSSVLSD